MIGHCHIRKFDVLYSHDNAQQYVMIREWTIMSHYLMEPSDFLACEYWGIYSVKSYCVDQKSNWKTIYLARVIEDIVTKVGSIHWYIRYISMYRIDRYCIEVISVFDLYFDMQKREDMCGIRSRNPLFCSRTTRLQGLLVLRQNLPELYLGFLNCCYGNR